jgi:hydroxymethylpyrimidine pyrophosphatase-like HAD family hydrolase
MELFVFLDLDDTIFQTKRKCPQDQPIFPAAFAQDGSVISFFTSKQARLFKLLNNKTRLVPTTARNHAAFLRTKIASFDYAIINHGGIILNADSSVHQGWFNSMKVLLEQVLNDLHQLKNTLQTEATKRNIPFKIRLIDDLGLTFYLLVKHDDKNHAALEMLLTDVIEPYLRNNDLDFYCHLNDNNLAVLPRFLNKAPAVSFLQKELDKQYSEYLSVGMGDSLTDIAYMQLCDYFMTPKNSQIVRECIGLYQPYLNAEV